ncbi:MAG: hypothetical protein ORN56_01275, partial [Chitinophagales bacterium]|nr:hypothetical protein [Chitinophagales bacterium]
MKAIKFLPIGFLFLASCTTGYQATRNQNNYDDVYSTSADRQRERDEYAQQERDRQAANEAAAQAAEDLRQKAEQDRQAQAQYDRQSNNDNDANRYSNRNDAQQYTDEDGNSTARRDAYN